MDLDNTGYFPPIFGLFLAVTDYLRLNRGSLPLMHRRIVIHCRCSVNCLDSGLSGQWTVWTVDCWTVDCLDNGLSGESRQWTMDIRQWTVWMVDIIDNGQLKVLIVDSGGQWTVVWLQVLWLHGCVAGLSLHCNFKNLKL